MRTLIVSAIFSIFGMVATSQAQDIGDVQQGHQFALDVCSSCHAVRAGQTQVSSGHSPQLRGDHPHARDDRSGPRVLAHDPISPDHAEPRPLAATGSQCVGLRSEPPGLAPKFKLRWLRNGT
jgi:hypothetical protein